MRGLYATTYLSSLAHYFATTRNKNELDIGKGFDLIVGTSTGAVIACALAAGIPLTRVSALYREHGAEIFPLKLPGKAGISLAYQVFARPRYLKSGAVALKNALHAEFGCTTLGDIWKDRQIALSIPAIEMSHHHPWVFKTPHLDNTKHRDSNSKLADVCLATTAAPIYRSMARIENSNASNHRVFVDGGLWANNPVLIGLIDALEMTTPKDQIEIFCLGTCSRPDGELIDSDGLDRGLREWKFGGKALGLAMDAQEIAFDEMAQMFSRHVDRDCQIIRFPHGDISESILKHLDLDVTDDTSLNALVAQADADVNKALSLCGKATDTGGQLLNDLFDSLPPKAGNTE